MIDHEEQPGLGIAVAMLSLVVAVFLTAITAIFYRGWWLILVFYSILFTVYFGYFKLLYWMNKRRMNDDR